MKFEFLRENDAGVKIYARIDDDEICRYTCTEDDIEYQSWLTGDING